MHQVYSGNPIISWFSINRFTLLACRLGSDFIIKGVGVIINIFKMLPIPVFMDARRILSDPTLKLRSHGPLWGKGSNNYQVQNNRVCVGRITIQLGGQGVLPQKILEN